MGIKTKIEWCDSSVNPIMGCTGCTLREKHCYAAILCARYVGRKGWPKSFDEPEFFPGRLEKAVRWSALAGKPRPGKPWLNGLPRHIFVNDLSDGFCPDVDPWQWLAPSIPSMHLSPHIWLLLTKWPDRMRQFFKEWNKPIPSNFYLGTTITSADDLWRVGELLQIQWAAVRFVSVEPMLGGVELPAEESFIDPDGFGWNGPMTTEMGNWSIDPDATIDWVICGGESGPGARPMHPDWARSLRNQCQAAGVAFFYKQAIINGKKISCPELDGKQWREMPNV